MDKFSKMSGEKINDSPKLVKSKEHIELEALKAGINKLIDNNLTIRSYGSARTELLMSSVKISGKEMFIEALIDFMTDKSLMDQIKSLESLKSETRDWQSIDNKISEIYKEISEKVEFSKNTYQITKIKTLLDTYGEDDRFETILENYTNRVKESKEASIISITAEKMKSDFKYQSYSKDKLSQISSKFLNRAKQLGFREDGSNN